MVAPSCQEQPKERLLVTTCRLSWLAVERALCLGAGKWFESPEINAVFPCSCLGVEQTAFLQHCERR